MNKILVLVAIIMILFSFFGGAYCGYESGKSHVYSWTGQIVEVNDEDNYILIEDHCGNLFEWGSSRYWELGDIVSMTMYDSRTARIEDDEILDISLAWTVNWD